MADSIEPARETGQRPSGANAPDPAAPPGDSGSGAPRPPDVLPRSGGFSDNDSVVSPLAETDDGDGDY